MGAWLPALIQQRWALTGHPLALVLAQMWFYKIAVQRAHFLLPEDFNSFALKFVYMLLESLDFSTIWSSWWDTSSVGSSPCRCLLLWTVLEGRDSQRLRRGTTDTAAVLGTFPQCLQFYQTPFFLPFKKWKLYLIILMFPIVFFPLQKKFQFLCSQESFLSDFYVCIVWKAFFPLWRL